MMKEVWNKDPAIWRSMSLVERLEAMRKWHCTGPCGQSCSTMGTRATLDATIRESQQAVEKSEKLQSELALLIDCKDYDQLHRRVMQLIE